MRASRLLSILTTLQARGQVTAPELAEACEVSVRTIYRDIDALAAAGIPVYADRGAAGQSASERRPDAGTLSSRCPKLVRRSRAAEASARHCRCAPAREPDRN